MLYKEVGHLRGEVGHLRREVGRHVPELSMLTITSYPHA